MSSVSGSAFDATVWAFVAMAPVAISAWFGLSLNPNKKITAYFLALSSGMLIALLSYDLVEEAFRMSGPYYALIGLFLGLLAFQFANDLIALAGVKRRQSIKCGGLGHLSSVQIQDRNTGLALLVGATLDGIPESMSIGISFLDNPLVSSSVILAVAVANIPEGLASGAGLKRSGVSRINIMFLWSAVVILCMISSFMAFSLMKDAPASIKGLITAFAGGGVLAMTFQSIIPEAYEGIKDRIGLVGGIGFAIAFIVSHVFH
jgi:ZIP family zinc transporter